MAKITPIDIDESYPDSITTQVKKAFQDLSQILIHLSPTDNFTGFLYTGTIAAATEVKIKNRLPKVPSGYLVTFCQSGNIQAGDTAWSKDFVYLKNAGAAAIKVKVFFFI